MSSKGKRVIYVGPADGSNHKPLYVEGRLDVSTALPGTIMEGVPGGIRVSQKPSTSFFREMLVADKDTSRSKSVDDVWPIGETLVAIQGRSGDFFHALVEDGTNITERGAPLALNGSGILKLANIPATVGATSDWVIAYSDEIINISGADALVRVRVP